MDDRCGGGSVLAAFCGCSAGAGDGGGGWEEMRPVVSGWDTETPPVDLRPVAFDLAIVLGVE